MIYKPKHFSTRELFPAILVGDYPEEYLLRAFDQALLKTIDNIREYFGAPMYINYAGKQCRGFRDCVACGKVGARLSAHRLGRAVDFNIEGYDAEEIRKAIIQNAHRFSAITRMEKFVSWVHIDTIPHNHHDGIYLFAP